ncbi:CZB domain-containing protein [Pseudorhodoplanes sp.]|uniref:CZB domain-containing protein n=1 Tax=Pseudorhodoplanes sp. TaxID=1934341 RepID=UPI0039191054
MSELLNSLDKAIAAHATWKRRLKTAAETGQSDVNPQTVAVDNQCEFGKWLYSATISPSDKGTDFDTVKKLHAQFHQCAAQTLSKALRRDKAGYESDMSLTGSFTSASAKLTEAMMAWKRRLAAKV